MPPVTRWLTTLFVYTSAFVGAGLLATACDPTYGVTSFRCDPANPDCPTDFGTGSYVCCSDDPAALDLDDLGAAALPRYAGKSGSGTPLFSGTNNNLSRSGFCIDTAQVPPSAAIQDPGSGFGCPLPCNPTWSNSDIQTVCGAGTVCCQSVELDEKDCALDPDLGDSGCWRPVTGNDIDSNAFDGLKTSNWSPSAHVTHQDPNGTGCTAFITASGGNNQALSACFRRLSVADQRGFCQSGVCPLTDPAYRDACERKNDGEGRTNCG
jgi:hypothetical protein